MIRCFLEKFQFQDSNFLGEMYLRSLVYLEYENQHRNTWVKRCKNSFELVFLLFKLLKPNLKPNF